MRASKRTTTAAADRGAAGRRERPVPAAGGVRRQRQAMAGSLATLVACAVGALVVPGGAAFAAGYNPATDPHSMAADTANTGATAWWNAGYTGKGIDVAVIDSGVSPVAGLNGTNKIVYGPDLSLESQTPNLRNLDTFGHGTFMAGLIAGHDAALTAPYAQAPASAYRGMAPDARIVSLKVATADGGADVSQVIAAINWVVQHKDDPGMKIRVLNLSYGTNSTQASTIDPLSYAAEQAWKKGIVVVAAGGNSGFHTDGLADPAYNPYIISVGASDSMGTATANDDIIGRFSAHGASKGRAPDFVVPGTHVQGLRVPSSYIDVSHPEGVIDGRYFRGSGTSQAAAITSGAVALILEKYPTITPDQVKLLLRSKAQPLNKVDVDDQGAGEIQLAPTLTAALSSQKQTLTNATGTGSLEASRGSDHISSKGVALTGEKDIFGHPVNTTSLATSEAAGSSWSGGSWNGSTWSGSTWSGSSWCGSSWSGSTWSGSTWSGSTWSGSTWSGSSWSGSTWSGSTWSGSSWT